MIILQFKIRENNGLRTTMTENRLDRLARMNVICRKKVDFHNVPNRRFCTQF